MVIKNVDGLTSAQAGGFVYPDPAIATDLSYVMEGVNNAVAIYRASTGALAYGPYAASSFFAPVYSSGDIFFNPQMYYDVMRDRWVVSWLQKHAARRDLPGHRHQRQQLADPAHPWRAVLHLSARHQLRAERLQSSDCQRMTMGADYWGLYFTCQNISLVPPLSATRCSLWASRRC